MSSKRSFNGKRQESATELFRMYLEKSGTMDALTGWIRKAVEISAEDRPRNSVEFLENNWNSWSGNVLNTAIKTAVEGTCDELDEITQENNSLRKCIEVYESILLRHRVDALEMTISAHNKES